MYKQGGRKMTGIEFWLSVFGAIILGLILLIIWIGVFRGVFPPPALKEINKEEEK